MGIGGSMFPQQAPELMIISTIHSKPCKYTPGDHYNFMSIVNKQVHPDWQSTLSSEAPVSGCLELWNVDCTKEWP